MDTRIKQGMKKIGGENVLFDASMSRYTTFRAGGNAEALYRAGDLHGLKEMVAFLMAEGIPFLVVGKGSNLLVRDGGLCGAVIILNGAFSLIEVSPHGEPSVVAGAGVALNKLVDLCAEKGLEGVEFLSGIPGTLGGGVAMNAGSWGEEMSCVIQEISVLGTSGTVQRRNRSELTFGYRELALAKDEIILDARLHLRFDEPDLIKKKVVSYRGQKKRRFPLDKPSAGSIFKNPEGDYAGRLIEAVGLKGRMIGDAMISGKHANFIVNTGASSASDIMALVDLAKEKVKEKFHIDLTPEIKVVGNA